MKSTEEIFSAYEYLPDGVVIYRVGEEKKILFANTAALEMFEYESFEALREAAQDDFLQLIQYDDAEKLKRSMEAAKINRLEKEHHYQYRIETASGTSKMLDDTAKVVHLPRLGEVVISALTRVDSGVIFAEETGDSLTHLLSASQFMKLAQEMLEKADAEDRPGQYNFMYFDIRNFKEYNVEFGTKAGDDVLIKLTRILQAHSTTNIISRFGGDHFVAVGQMDTLEERAREIISDFNLLYFSKGMTLKVGVYQALKKDIDVMLACDLAKAACDSIHDSKENMRLYDKELSRKLGLYRYVTAHIDEAIENHYIKAYYQPVIRTINGRLCGVEALARWIDPVQGFLSPADFIPALEENMQITKLDLFMVKEICREMKLSEEKGETMIPVSINLSRLDFLTCDIFSEVEKIVKSYNVARDMINIEITESMIIDHPEIVQQAVIRFRDAGYQVWMDDFGSGFSSLNVLQHYDFDEIKLDMVFMRNFNEKSKAIIRSVIDMAKKIGIQTLAEGVETKEQFEFLKSIGCERVQGYYFSQPQPYQMLHDTMNRKEIVAENRGWRQFYDKVGLVDFMTDRPLAIVEYDDTDFDYLFMNDAYKEVLYSTGRNDMQAVMDSTNSRESKLSGIIRQYQKMLHLDEEFKAFTYTVNGRMMRIRMKMISNAYHHAIDCLEITNITQEESAEERERFALLNRAAFKIFDTVYAYDPKKKSARTLKRSTYNNLSPEDIVYTEDGVDFRRIAERYIHRDDRERYLKFIDNKHKIERIKESGRSCISGLFRTLTNNGSYIWKRHVEQYEDDNELFIYSTMVTTLQGTDLSRVNSEEFDEIVNYDSRSIEQSRLLWDGLQESQTINLFWKDKNRRFVGVNSRFLESYGFDSEDELIGKTDEEMRWHMDDGPFRDDELDILENGTVVRNRIGKCLIRGGLHHIIVNKEPIYRNGEIVGLIGTFINADDLVDEIGSTSKLSQTDWLTGLLSAQGIVNTLAEFIEAYELRGEKFVAAKVTYRNYHRLVSSYGETTTRGMICQLGDIFQKELIKLAEYHVVGARLYSGHFVLLANYENRSDIEGLLAYLRQKSDGVRELNGYPVTLNPQIEVRYIEDTDLEEIVPFVTGGMRLQAEKE